MLDIVVKSQKFSNHCLFILPANISYHLLRIRQGVMLYTDCSEICGILFSAKTTY